MDDTDLYMKLATSKEKTEAARAFAKKLRAPPSPAITKMREAVASMSKAVGKSKKAGAKETAIEYLRALKPELIGGGVGALAGGTYGYLASKPKGKEPSALERAAAERLAEHDTAARRYRKEGVKPGAGHKINGVFARAFKDWARVLKEHPRAAAAIYGAAGAGAGARVARGATNFLSESKDLV